jgi:hypothetical protein
MLNASAVQRKLAWKSNQVVAGLDHFNRLSTIEIDLSVHGKIDIDMLGYYGMTKECHEAIHEVLSIHQHW